MMPPQNIHVKGKKPQPLKKITNDWKIFTGAWFRYKFRVIIIFDSLFSLSNHSIYYSQQGFSTVVQENERKQKDLCGQLNINEKEMS